MLRKTFKLNHSIHYECIRNCFVPASQNIFESDVQYLQDFIDQSTRLTVITGAGISTESGIPDYRSKDVGLYSKNGYRPMNYSEFLNEHSSRQRYWARSFLGWNYMRNREPNISHITLAEWQKRRKIFSCVTQNVDRLHQKAGMKSVIELHGNLYTVKCITCNQRQSREHFQKVLTDLNKDILEEDWIKTVLLGQSYHKTLRPDGDIDVENDFLNSFQIPYCERCTGILKPDIVFFGDNVPLELVNKIYETVEKSDSILVIGSSLQVYSSYRFVLQAHLSGKRIAIINIGPTRGDGLKGVLKIESKISEIITKIST
ncbi:NAD-dependent protein lipoamidase sirtuin-4 [Sarcoptes scabiei]|uniref:NAD-dependent deacetylase sirtuin-4-like protein n=1 Tax=Sarcoptes scabiei TaxID=52283 RepID=A0A131ZWL5_SARSC|nr:NAD-dependent protein lipoamidase sirtuin-4 [Sarcoptes scabiei]KPM02500.1 NAD-dependent deacetylase sirtuin-4-like protein [Sarcoptes scabiei]